MNKRAFTIIVIILLLAVGGIVYLLATSKDESPGDNTATTSSAQTEDEVAAAPSEEEPATTKGTYVEYEDGIVAATAGTKLLFFHAPWCPQCRALEADIKARGVPDGVTIIKVDYDSSQSLRQKYGVTLQTTVVRVDDSGQLVEKFVAYDDPSLAAVTKELL